jgi:Protein of unknown function (DUF2937)
MVQTIARADRLEEELKEMQSAGPLERIYVMAKDLDPEIAGHSLDDYEPASRYRLKLSWLPGWLQLGVGRGRISSLGRSVEYAGRNSWRRRSSIMCRRTIWRSSSSCWRASTWICRRSSQATKAGLVSRHSIRA